MKTTSFILCDQIRKEDSGRLILLGVFPTLKIVNNLPLNERWGRSFPFFIYVGLSFDRSQDAGLYRLEATIRSNGKRHHLLNLDVKSEGNDSIGLPLFTNLEFPNADTVDVEIFRAENETERMVIGSFSFLDEVT